jgi:hypothetical protein
MKKQKSLLTLAFGCDIISRNLLKCVDGIIPLPHFIFRESAAGVSRHERKRKSRSGAEVLKAE